MRTILPIKNKENEMKKSEMIINEFGVWIDIEEEVTNLHEIKFNKDGMSIDEDFLFSWVELENIKNKAITIGE